MSAATNYSAEDLKGCMHHLLALHAAAHAATDYMSPYLAGSDGSGGGGGGAGQTTGSAEWQVTGMALQLLSSTGLSIAVRDKYSTHQWFCAGKVTPRQFDFTGRPPVWTTISP